MLNRRPNKLEFRSVGRVADSIFTLLLIMLFVRGLFSGWDVHYDFDLPKTLRWAIDLGIYMLLGLVCFCRARKKRLVRIICMTLFFLFTSLFTISTNHGGAFDIEKSISLLIVNALQFASMCFAFNAAINGDIGASDRVVRVFRVLGILYTLACIGIGFGIGQHYLGGGDPLVVGGRFFFVNPITMRMSATFSEPSYFGFFVGFCALYLYSCTPSKVSVLFIGLSCFLLIFFVGAKFSIIALVLSLVLAPLFRLAPLNFIRASFYVLIVALCVMTVMGLDSFVYKEVFSVIDYDGQQTFVTRFGYIFTSLKHLLEYPVGTGFGGWLVSLRDGLSETVEITSGLDNQEIQEHVLTGFNFAPKDTASLVLLVAGWVGVFLAVELIIVLVNKSRARSSAWTVVVLYLVLSAAVYINAIAVPIFFFVLIVVCLELSPRKQWSSKIRENISDRKVPAKV